MEKKKVDLYNLQTKICTISGHNSQILSVCTNPNCDKQPIACAKCIAAFHLNCGEELIFLEDIFSDKAENLLSHPKFEGLAIKQDALEGNKAIAEEEFKALFLNSLNEEINNLKNSLIMSLDVLSDEIKNMKPEELDKCLSDLYKGFLDHLTENDALKEVISVKDLQEKIKLFLLKNEQTPEFNLSIKTYFENYFNSLEQKKKDFQGMYWNFIVKAFARKQTDSSISSISEKLNQMILSPQVMNQIFSAKVLWHWNPDKMENYIELTENNMVATKKNYVGHHGVFGNQAFTEGKHIWKITCLNITSDNGDWIQFGLAEEGHFPLASYNTNTYSIASGNYNEGKNYFYNMEYEGGVINFNNKVFTCEYDADEGVLTITGDGIKATKKDLKGKKLYPFANVYHDNNQVKLEVIQ